jgi:surface antigen
MSKPYLASVLVLTLLAGACTAPTAGNGPGPKQATGAAVGAVGGAVLGGMAGNALGGKGKNAVAIGTGAALGGLGGLFLGSSAGASLDRADRLYAERSWTSAMAAPVGQPIAWENPETGNRGHTVTTRQGRLATSNQTCREYTSEIIVGGRRETMVGTACRNPDGTWSGYS